MTSTGRAIAKLLLTAVIACSQPVQTLAQEPGALAGPTYADLADLADSAPLVVHAQVRSYVRVKDERAPGLRPGWGRYFVKARTQALLTGNTPVGESLQYLADLRLDAEGRPPRIRRARVLLFARVAPGRPGELQLVAPDAQVLWTPEREAMVRSILIALTDPAAPGRVTGVREIIHVPGALAGEGETQIFLSTADRSAASITVRHRPGQRPAWGVSFSELVADVGNVPRPGTLAWYRLACFLPDRLPSGTNLSETAATRAQAQSDYLMVLGELGICGRERR